MSSKSALERKFECWEDLDDKKTVRENVAHKPQMQIDDIRINGKQNNLGQTVKKPKIKF